ncbi:MAG: AGE family epimerase/isomerase [Mariniphaga sp.]|nr:AGE family epimerase/isomerase [Mariniphaga sp.]
MDKSTLLLLKKEFEDELKSHILDFWGREVYDSHRRTFFGRITHDGLKDPEAPLSAVFVTRIMWTFSAVYKLYPEELYKNIADEAFRILQETFWDSLNGGIYWSVLPNGKPVDTKKQFYAEAFFIYALAEYDAAFPQNRVKQLAHSMFMLLEKFGYDPEYDGYIEAMTDNWQDIEDQRLSPRELNVKKTMNTHLHILEAYTHYYRVWKTEESRNKLYHLINLFLDKIIDPKRAHFRLFFDADWTLRSGIDSYGHDIEGSWMLCEAAETLGDRELMEKVKRIALKMSEVTRNEGFHETGGLYYEKENDTMLRQFDWWPQAESVVGFFNAWQLTGDEKFLKTSLRSWKFIRNYIVDRKNGEWHWGVSANLVPLEMDKINGWKSSYHNGRMCLEMIRRMNRMIL